MLIKEETLRNLPFRSLKSCKRPETLLVAVGTSKPLLGKASKIDLAPWTSWRCQHGLSSAQYGSQWPIRIIVHPLKVSTAFKYLSVWAMSMSICLLTEPPSIVKLGVECGSLPPNQSNSFAITAVAKKTIQHTRKSNLDLFRILAS